MDPPTAQSMSATEDFQDKSLDGWYVRPIQPFLFSSRSALLALRLIACFFVSHTE
jgi:hypothetical protein